MEFERVTKNSFSVIGIEGSTADGDGFVQNLWEKANSRFSEIAAFAKCDESGSFCGFWGAMSDISHSFKPWEDNFSRGLYLAGAEVIDDATAPSGWSKWAIPSYEYIRVKCDGSDVFHKTLDYLRTNDIPLVGAVQDFTDPKTGANYMYFPIKKL